MLPKQHFSKYNALNYSCTGINRDRPGRLMPMAAPRGHDHRHWLSGTAPCPPLIDNTGGFDRPGTGRNL